MKSCTFVMSPLYITSVTPALTAGAVLRGAPPPTTPALPGAAGSLTPSHQGQVQGRCAPDASEQSPPNESLRFNMRLLRWQLAMTRFAMV